VRKGRKRTHRQATGERDYPPVRWWWTILYMVALAILLGFLTAELLWLFIRFLATKEPEGP